MRNWMITAFLLLLPLILAPFAGRYYTPIHIPAEVEGAVLTTTTGYTIFQRGQVLPKYVYVSDVTGTMEYLNPGPVPGYPTTFGAKLCYSSPFNLYSAADAERLEVWQDTKGTATVSEVLNVCPQFTP